MMKFFQRNYMYIFQTLIFLIISANMNGVTMGQVQLGDSLPNNLGPEQPTATQTTGCPAACDLKLIEALSLIADLERRLSTLNITVNSRLNQVPTGGTAPTDELSARVINLENYLYGNMTIVTNKLAADLSYTSTTFSQNITDTRNYLEGRISSASFGSVAPSSSFPTGDPTSPVVYANITARLDNLENSKVQTLIEENEVWRRNFEVVSKTFSKMKKSNYSNDVIVVSK